jgi:uncharacterized iron-regulated membrane protein
MFTDGLRSVSIDVQTGEVFPDMRYRRDANVGKFIHALVDVHDVDQLAGLGRLVSA